MLPEKNKIISNEIEKKIDNMIETSKEEIMTVAFTCLIQAYFVTYIYPNETLKHALLAIITPLIGIGASRKGEITAITVYVVTFGLIMALNTEISAFFVGTAMINTANVSSIACNEIKKVNKKSKKTPIITIPIIIYMNISIIFF